MKSLFSSQVFTLGANGMEEIKQTPVLPVGCIVYAYGYGMHQTPGAIISGPDAGGNYKGVYTSDYKSGFFTLDRYSRPHSKKFGIGHYYSDTFETVAPEILAEYIEKAKEAEVQKAKAAKEKAEADAKELKELPERFPHLTPNPSGDSKQTKANIFADLKQNFPGIKFSISKISSGNGYQIKWTDGPTTGQVSKIADKYEDHENDESGDFRDFKPTNFTKTFGGEKYIFQERGKSEAVQNLLPEIESASGLKGYEASNLLHRIFSAQSFPAGAEITGISRTEITCGQLEDFYKIDYTETTPQAAAPVEIPTGSVQIVDYSPKAVAIIGETKPIKEALKKLGGRFNPRLTCGPGWIFPKSKTQDLTALINQA